MHLKFLGTSSGLGIPRAKCKCSQCQSKDPRDKRTRSALLVDNKILIDCGPDIIRQIQSSKLKVQKLTHAIITHRHFDHIGGIKKLKSKNEKVKIIYLDKKQKFKIGKIQFQAFLVPHAKKIKTYGLTISHKPYAISRLVYIPDFSQLTHRVCNNIANSKLATLDGSVLSCNFGGHLAIRNQIKLLKPYTLHLKPIIYFTHNGHTRIPHRDLEKITQNLGNKNFHLAYDGLELTI